MYDYVHNKLPLSFNNLFKFNCDVYDAYETRRAQMFHIPRTKSRFVDKLPLYNFPSMWNNWYSQLHVNTTVTRGTLKYYIKTILMNNYATFVKCDNPRCMDSIDNIMFKISSWASSICLVVSLLHCDGCCSRLCTCTPTAPLSYVIVHVWGSRKTIYSRLCCSPHFHHNNYYI